MSHDLEKQQFYKQYSNKLNKIMYKAKKFFYVDLFEECFIHLLIALITTLVKLELN